MHSLIAKVLVALAAVVALAGCGGGKKATATATPPPTAKPALPPVAPLTGLPDPLGAARKRCAITVKIDNTKEGHPKYGVDQADVVYEEVVEGGYTRLAAIFNSQAPDRVGPVRSVRKTDQSLVWPIGGVFAYSGGAPYAIASISTAPVVQLDESRAGPLMFRDRSRDKPLNLYAHVNFMYSRCGTPVPPPAVFTYRGAHVAVGGVPAASARVGFLADFAVTWTWDAPSGTWKRSIFGSPEVVASGAQFAPKNVVVMFVSYIGGDPQHFNIGAEAVLTGKGKALVFTAGKEITATWSRPDKSRPAQLLDAVGKAIALTPGQTWVELPELTYSVTKTP
ncbi:MAG: hypothetical protein QOH28_3919 [Actinomycetota bacterium]|jgi:hypothetical protein|nr:hypothetical protein [Actinomycetota bacterium]